METAKAHTEAGLKRTSDSNLEKLAKDLGLNLIVAENGKTQVIDAILQTEAKIAIAQGIQQEETADTALAASIPPMPDAVGVVTTDIIASGPLKTEAQIRAEIMEELAGEAQAPTIQTTASNRQPRNDLQRATEDEGSVPKRARLIFPENEEEDERASEVRLSVNGQTIRCKRGSEVSIPYQHYCALMDAVETRYVPRKKMIEGLPSTIEKQVPRFPHQFIRYEY